MIKNLKSKSKKKEILELISHVEEEIKVGLTLTYNVQRSEIWDDLSEEMQEEVNRIKKELHANKNKLENHPTIKLLNDGIKETINYLNKVKKETDQIQDWLETGELAPSKEKANIYNVTGSLLPTDKDKILIDWYESRKIKIKDWESIKENLQEEIESVEYLKEQIEGDKSESTLLEIKNQIIVIKNDVFHLNQLAEDISHSVRLLINEEVKKSEKHLRFDEKWQIGGTSSNI